jgi:hypothetical protein
VTDQNLLHTSPHLHFLLLIGGMCLSFLFPVVLGVHCLNKAMYSSAQHLTFHTTLFSTGSGPGKANPIIVTKTAHKSLCNKCRK